MFLKDLSHADWITQLQHSLSHLEDLLHHGFISKEEAQDLRILPPSSLRITPYYASLITSSPTCPIRLQAIPQSFERDPVLPDWAIQWSQCIYARDTPWHADAIGDLVHLGAPRLTHRYHNRAILHLASTCAMYCRFCFRKSHLNHHEKSLYQEPLTLAWDYLTQHSEIQEVILTGGDPLTHKASTLEKILKTLDSFAHIRIVRIHSRMLTTLPQRFLDPELINVLQQKRNFILYLVNHFNHPQELTPQVDEALQALKNSLPLLNQSVLLKNINDHPDTLRSLFQELYTRGILPFYLHHPDWTPSTFGWRIPIQKGLQLYHSLKGTLSGPAVPRYVLDLPQGHGKIDLSSLNLKQNLSSQSSSIQGALYEASPPQTRTSSPQPILYLDLWNS